MSKVRTTSYHPKGKQKMSNLELNKGDNFIFGLDVSASMTQTDCPGGRSRIEFSKESAITFAKEAAKYDTDGIDLITFGHALNEFLGVTGEKAGDIIGALKATEGATMTHALIDKAYAMHKAAGKQQTVLFIVTDGEPSDPDAVAKSITTIAADLKDEHEFAISFLTVGVRSPALEQYLTKLDDNLKAKYDIVDVKKLEEVDFMTAFVGALHD